MSESELTEATGAALRPSGLGQLESTIATELAIAIFNARPLDKIRHVLEAFFLLPKESRDKIATKAGREMLADMHTLAISFLDMQIFVDAWGGKLAMIPFPFTKGEAVKYLSPFVKNFYKPEDATNEWCSRFLKGDVETRRGYFVWFGGKLTTKCSIRMAFLVKNEFVQWAMPEAIKLANDIITRFISKETWEQALAATLGRSSRHGSPSADI